MVIVEGLERRYGALKAVTDLNFTIQRGEVVGLLGQNGAGKTTCMKMITGYLDPSVGRVTIDELDIVEDRIAAQRLIGYLPESAPLYPDLLVEEYLELIADLRGLTNADRPSAIKDALEATGLTARRQQLIGTLSKGYRQRVGLAQAIIHKPKLLILDEPTNGLDPLQITEIRSLIKRLAHDTTIFLSTHILSEIEAVCDRALILIEGELAADRSLKELQTGAEIRLNVRIPQEREADFTESLNAFVERSEVAHSARALDVDVQGFAQYSLEYEGDAAPVITALARLTLEHEGELGGVHPQHVSLEDAFRTLLEHHAARSREAGHQVSSSTLTTATSELPPTSPTSGSSHTSNTSERGHA